MSKLVNESAYLCLGKPKVTAFWFINSVKTVILVQQLRQNGSRTLAKLSVFAIFWFNKSVNLQLLVDRYIACGDKFIALID